MQHVRFGRTGLQVSRLCLGTMTFGLQCDEATSFRILVIDVATGHQTPARYQLLPVTRMK